MVFSNFQVNSYALKFLQHTGGNHKAGKSEIWVSSSILCPFSVGFWSIINCMLRHRGKKSPKWLIADFFLLLRHRHWMKPFSASSTYEKRKIKFMQVWKTNSRRGESCNFRVNMKPNLHHYIDMAWCTFEAAGNNHWVKFQLFILQLHDNMTWCES